MYAVIKTGGKQYRVQTGDELRVERIKGADKGSEIEFDQILLVGGDEGVTIGQPNVEGASVKATLVDNGRARKVIVFKSKRRGGYRKKRGHRQHYSHIRITDISV